MRRIVTACVALALAVAPGCSGEKKTQQTAAGREAAAKHEAACEKAVDRMIACMADKVASVADDMKKSRTKDVRRCVSHWQSREAAAACLASTDCDKFVKCLIEKRGG